MAVAAGNEATTRRTGVVLRAAQRLPREVYDAVHAFQIRVESEFVFIVVGSGENGLGCE